MPAIYLFPVPLADGNPADVLPERNLRLLGEIRYFVVENIRSARRFLRSVSADIVIDDLHFCELSEHTKPEEIAPMLDPIEEGHSIGVLSEAGCPAVADPGSDLVAIAQRRGYTVVPLVGPSSILLALMASGFNGQRFTFHGYLPVDSGAKTAALRDIERDIRRNHCTHIFIETPYRNNKLTEFIIKTLPADMKMCIASDISGPRESIVTLTLAQWRARAFDYSKIPAIFLLYF